MCQTRTPILGCPVLRSSVRWGDMGAALSTAAASRGIAMAAVSARRTLLVPALVSLVHTTALAQTAAPPPTRGVVASGATAAWTLRLKGDIRWQQVTPAGVLLVSTDAALAGVDIDRGQVTWEKPELGGLPADSVRVIEGSLLVEAARPGLLVILDPVTGAVLFDSRRPGLTQIVTRRVLPQSGTLLVHGRRATGPAVVALYDLVTGEQRWVNEALFEQTEPKKKGLGGLMQGLVRAASEATALEVLQAGPDMIVVHTLMGLRALDARSGAVRWSATLPTARAGNPARHVRLFPSLDKTDRIYVGFDDRLMAYRLADGQALWSKPATIDGWVHGIVQHPNGIIILPESPPANQATGNVRIVNGVVQTGLNVARYEDGTTIYVFASHDHRLYAVDRNAGTYRALGGEIKLQGGEDPTAMELRPAGLVLIAPQNLVVVSREGQVKQQVYYPAPQLPGLLRALYRINAVRAGLYGAAASAYGDAFAQASRNATDSTTRRITGQMATAYTQGGAQLVGYSHQAAALATKRFKASLSVPGSVFMLTRAPEGNGNVLLQIDKDSGQPRSRVDLGKEREPAYAVDDVANMLFLRSASGSLVAYRL